MGDIIDINSFQQEKQEEFEPLVVSLKDDEGNEFEFTVLDIVEAEHNNIKQSYAIMVHNTGEEDNDLIIMRFNDDGSETATFEGIQDEDEFNSVVSWMENHSQKYSQK